MAGSQPFTIAAPEELELLDDELLVLVLVDELLLLELELLIEPPAPLDEDAELDDEVVPELLD